MGRYISVVISASCWDCFYLIIVDWLIVESVLMLIIESLSYSLVSFTHRRSR